MQKKYSKLILDIQKKSKIEVLTVRDLKYLQEEILVTTNKTVSFNTLRRFYGFLNSTNPSLATLNIFSQYLGFNNYSKYLSDVENYDEWYFQIKMLHLQLNQYELKKNDVVKFNDVLQNENNIIAVANYVSFLIENNRIDSLTVFFNHFDYINLTDSAITKFAHIATFSFYKLEIQIALNIHKILIPFESFRNTLPLRYIDYSHLNGYYIEVIKMINKFNANNSDVLFATLMEFYHKFYSDEDCSKILIDFPKKVGNIYPVLLGRYYGYKILTEEKIDKLLKKNIMEELKSTHQHLFLIEIVPSLIIKEEYNFLDSIIDKYYEEIFEIDRWSSKSSVANYLIGLANVNISKGYLSAAKNNLGLVELDKIELAYMDYITLFFLLTKIKLYSYEKDIHKVNDNYFKLKELANKIGFYKFISVSKKYLNHDINV